MKQALNQQSASCGTIGHHSMTMKAPERARGVMRPGFSQLGYNSSFYFHGRGGVMGMQLMLKAALLGV